MFNSKERKLIILEKRESTLSIQTIANDNASFRYKARSSNFLILNSHIEDLIFRGSTIDRDIYSFIEMYVSNDKTILNIKITWLTGVGENKRKGEEERFSISFQKFMFFWHKEDMKELRIINLIEEYPPTFEFKCPERIHEVVSNKFLKRKFIKALKHFQFTRNRPEKLVFMSDFVKYSFYWEEYSAEGKRQMNGGLILHPDYSDPENLEKAKYSTHT